MGTPSTEVINAAISDVLATKYDPTIKITGSLAELEFCETYDISLGQLLALSKKLKTTDITITSKWNTEMAIRWT